ncbi:MAG: iron-containing alcohol dehydrogenase [Sporomusaceae bacterium]|nr:iron-containing alcohol dehydrogenase [Sporomusaceae bacterium]
MDFEGQYTLFNAGKITAGLNSVESLAEIIKEETVKKVLIITDQGVFHAGLIDKPKAVMEAAGAVVAMINTTPPEPTVQQVEEIVAEAKASDCEMIVGIGGGSSMDVAKLVAVLLTNDVTLPELVRGAVITKQGIPTVMIPTTAGTGSEVTYNAIVLVPEEELKVGIVSPKMMAAYVILDPTLTLKLPKAITAATGMDALAHAMECYISKKANPFSDTYALKAIQLISRSLRTAYRDGDNVSARHDMLLGAMLAGICIATSSTTAVHALAYPLGGKYRIPHGLSNAVLLPHVMNVTIDAAEEKFKDIAQAMELPVAGLSSREAAEKMIENLYSLNHDLELSVNWDEKGITAKDIDFMAEAALKVTRLLNNHPKVLGKEAIKEIYQKLF